MPRARLLPLLLLLVAACGRAPFGAAPASPRERYARALADGGLTNTALARDWLAAGARALATRGAVAPPLAERGFLPAAEPLAAAWHVRAPRGRRLVVRVDAEADSGTRVFTELFALGTGRDTVPRLVAASDSAHVTLATDVDDADATYLVRLQGELLRPVRYAVRLETAPSLAVFPVSGRGAAAVQSFWGAERDGGGRRHEGIDVFAPRGTPVVAAAGGIANPSENGLGGRVVFVYDAVRGQSLYYAHLDTQLVAPGALVRAGDTLGRVGNTGNARTTPPHLHFGIYRRGEGAVDPWPFVDPRVASAPRPAVGVALVGFPARTRAETAVLRVAPAGGAAVVAPLARASVLAVDGAAGDWLRARLPDGTRGWLRAADAEPLGTPVERARVAAAAPVRVRPAPDAPTLAVAAAGELPVLGRFGRYRLVQAAPGARGWVDAGD